jgi:hypothetical protein
MVGKRGGFEQSESDSGRHRNTMLAFQEEHDQQREVIESFEKRTAKKAARNRELKKMRAGVSLADHDASEAVA